MERAVDDNEHFGLEPMSQIEFEEASVEELRAMIVRPEQQAKVYTCAEILTLNQDKFFDCLRKNFTKEETAAIIACDPRNTAAKGALVRSMNRVFGSWRELSRTMTAGAEPQGGKAICAEAPSINTAESVTMTQREAERRRAFLDNSFGEEDML